MAVDRDRISAGPVEHDGRGWLGDVDAENG